MKLSDKLTSISEDQTVAELNSLLNSAEVSIDWWGRRLVRVKGYEENVEINELAKKFLASNVFNNNLLQTEKINGFQLWDKLKDLFNVSQTELEKTCFLRYLTPSLTDINSSPFATVVICDDKVRGIGYRKKTKLLNTAEDK